VHAYVVFSELAIYTLRGRQRRINIILWGGDPSWSETGGFCYVCTPQTGPGLKREHRECSNNSILLSPTDNWEGKCIPVVRKAVWFDDHPSWHIEEHLKCAFLRSYLLPWIYVWILSTPYSNSLAVQISCMFQKECRLETFSTKALVCIVIFSLVVKTPNHSLAFVKNLALTLVLVI